MKEQTKNIIEEIRTNFKLKEELNAALSILNEGREYQNNFKMLVTEFISIAATENISLYWNELESWGIEEHERLFEFLDDHRVNSYVNERTGEVVDLYSLDIEVAKVTFATDQHGGINHPKNYIDLVNEIKDKEE